MGRRLGEILNEDFGWPGSRIEAALSRQRDSDQPRLPLGRILIQDGGVGERSEVGVALLIQRLERRENAGFARPFDAIEYADLASQARDDHDDMSAKSRAYALIMVGLILYVAYPINTVISNGEAGLGRLSGLTRLYAGTGIVLVLCALFVGDSVVKGYALFVKRRWRVALSKRRLREAAIRRGDATKTAMPWRDASLERVGTKDVLERPDPDIAGVQHFLPVIYSCAALAKLGVLVFFLASGLRRSLLVDLPSLYRAGDIVLIFAPLWYWIVGAMCERYHKTLAEAKQITVDQLFPRASTRHVTGQDLWRRLGWRHVGYLLAWAGIIFLGCEALAAKESTLVKKSNLLFVASVVLIVLRVIYIGYKLKNIKIVSHEKALPPVEEGRPLARK